MVIIAISGFVQSIHFRHGRYLQQSAQYVIDASSVSLFQKYLMQIVRFRCKSGDPAWTASFSRLAEHTFEESGYN